jgi:ATP-dependent Clp protease ATP-binding subunit ClpB
MKASRALAGAARAFATPRAAPRAAAAWAPPRRLGVPAPPAAALASLAALRGHLDALRAPAGLHALGRRGAPLRAFAAGAAAGGAGGKRIQQKDYTEKAWEAIVAAPDIARERSQQIVETEHLLKALLEQPNGLARRVAAKAGASASRLLEATDAFIARQPRVSGAAEQVLGRSLEALITAAEKLKKKWGDEFVSVEELLMAYADDERFGRQLLKEQGLTREALEEAIMAVRGGKTVTDADPEGKYEALTRYGRDLTQAAREGKLDPVIGRDDEIRRAIQILSRRTKNNPVLIGEVRWFGGGRRVVGGFVVGLCCGVGVDGRSLHRSAAAPALQFVFILI